MEGKSKEYNLLSSIEQKVGVLQSSSCLLSVNAMSLSTAVDVCRGIKYFELLLANWQSCLPLGEAGDVNFVVWGNKMWEMIQEVRKVYSLNNVFLNLYEYESASYLDFKRNQAEVGLMDDSLMPLQTVTGGDVGIILVCALRELGEVLMHISEFLNSPTEKLITTSFEKWQECYKKHYHDACQKRYARWKIQYTARTLKKHLQEHMSEEQETLKMLFMSDDEFEMVYDAEMKEIDVEGVSRFLFSNVDRFGVSYIDNHPMFSKELLILFDFIDTWQMIQADLRPRKKPSEKETAPIVDELESKVGKHVSKIQHLVSESWKPHFPKLWKGIYQHFHSEIGKAGSREKFKEYSKKTVYCIIGHLKSKGVYRQDVTNVKMTVLLEGENNGMRKYLNNGLTELEPSLKERVEAYVETELKALAA